MKVALITDTHWGVRGDNPNFLRANRTFFKEIFFPILEKLDIKRVIHCGDLMDRRSVTNTLTASMMLDYYFSVAEKMGITTDIILGNHDVYFKDSNIPASPSILDLGDNVNIFSESLNHNLGGVDVLYLPWINETNLSEAMVAVKTSKSRFCFAHLALNGFTMNSGAVCRDGLDASDFSHFDVVFTGHFHKKSQDGNIVYLGSPMPFDWGEHGDPRGFHILDLSTGDLAFIENKHHLFTKVFYDDSEKKDYNELKLDFREGDFRGKYVKFYIQNVSNESWLDSIINECSGYGSIRISLIDERIRTREDIFEEIDIEDTITHIKKASERYATEEITASMLETHLINLHERAKMKYEI